METDDEKCPYCRCHIVEDKLTDRLDIANKTIDAQKIVIKSIQHSRRELCGALEQWIMDHGDRCRICADRSQAALKTASALGDK